MTPLAVNYLVSLSRLINKNKDFLMAQRDRESRREMNFFVLGCLSRIDSVSLGVFESQHV